MDYSPPVGSITRRRALGLGASVLGSVCGLQLGRSGTSAAAAPVGSIGEATALWQNLAGGYGDLAKDGHQGVARRLSGVINEQADGTRREMTALAREVSRALASQHRRIGELRSAFAASAAATKHDHEAELIATAHAFLCDIAFADLREMA